MDQISHFIKYIFEHPDESLQLLAFILTVVKLFHWGNSKQNALDLVIKAVETTRSSAVKKEVASSMQETPGSVQDSITDSVKAADEKKTTPTSWAVFLKELIRLPLPGK